MYKTIDTNKSGKRHFSITEEADVQKLPKMGQNGDSAASVDSVSDEPCACGSTALLAKDSRVFYLDLDNTWVEL